MSKVRINDLARELEVKSKSILDVLLEIGVTEKKSHSSSLEDHEAEKVRALFPTASQAQTSSRFSRPGRTEADEIKTKIDLSHISKPGDALRSIISKQQAAAATSEVHPQSPPTPEPASAPPAPRMVVPSTTPRPTYSAPAPPRLVVPTSHPRLQTPPATPETSSNSVTFSSKLRINHLARELNLKTRTILEVLPLVGVNEKKADLSSIEVHEAERVRKYLRTHPVFIARFNFGIIEGTVRKITSTLAYVDLGFQPLGSIPLDELLDCEDGTPQFHPDNNVPVIIEEGETRDGYLKLSHHEALRKIDYVEYMQKMWIELSGIESTDRLKAEERYKTEHPPRLRIFDLAKELEIKSKAILDTLPLVGVTEKDAQSSPIEAAEAEKVRAYFRVFDHRFDFLDDSSMIQINDLAAGFKLDSSDIIEALSLIGVVSDNLTPLSSIQVRYAKKVKAYFHALSGPPRLPAPPNVEKPSAKVDLSDLSKSDDLLRAVSRHNAEPAAPPPTLPVLLSEIAIASESPVAGLPPGSRVSSPTEPIPEPALVTSTPIPARTIATAVSSSASERHHILWIDRDEAALTYKYHWVDTNGSDAVPPCPHAFDEAEEKEVKDTVNELSRSLGWLSSHVSPGKPNLMEFRELAKDLYGRLIPADLHNAIHPTKLSQYKVFGNLTVWLPWDLTWIPWELLWDGEEFLCLRFNIARRIQHTREEYVEAQQRVGITRSGRGALILHGNVSGLNAEEETLRIQKHIDSMKFLFVVDREIKKKDILRELRQDHDICHFIGHGKYDEKDPEQSGWELSDGSVLTCSQIQKRVSNDIFPQLIFANACLSAPLVSAREKYIGSLHLAFLRLGVPQYIGTITEIPEHYEKPERWTHGRQSPEQKPAAEFAECFYRLLASGQSIGEALGNARREFFEKPGIPIWTMYIHYGDPLSRFIKQPVRRKHWTQHPKADSATHQPSSAAEVFLLPKKLAEAKNHLRALAEGRSHVLLLAGEAQSGKTTFLTSLQRFAHEAVQEIGDIVFAIGTCDGSDRLPYSPFREIFRLLVSNNGVTQHSEMRATIGEFIATVLLESFPNLVMHFGLAHYIDMHVWQQLGIEPENLPPEHAQVEQKVIFASVGGFLRELAHTLPLVIAVENLQWADDATRALLLYLSRTLRDTGVLLVGTYRSHVVHNGQQIDRYLNEARMLGAQTISLELPIHDPTHWERSKSVVAWASSRALVVRYLRFVLPIHSSTERPGRVLVDTLADYSAGNMFILSELVKWLRERGQIISVPGFLYKIWKLKGGDKIDDGIELPESIKAMVDNRFEALNDELQRTLLFASVEEVRLTFSMDVLSHLLELDEHIVHRHLQNLCQQHQLVEEWDGEKANLERMPTFKFRNRAIRWHVYRKQSKGRRQQLHKKVGEYLERIYKDQRDIIAPDLAIHFDLAGQHEKASQYGRQAAKALGANFMRASKYFEHARKIAIPEQSATTTDIDKELQAIRLGLHFESGFNHYSLKPRALMSDDELRWLGETMQMLEEAGSVPECALRYSSDQYRQYRRP